MSLSAFYGKPYLYCCGFCYFCENYYIMNFTSIDFETANSHRNSPCSLGITVVENGRIMIEKEWLIQPPRNHYNERNILVHGIYRALG